MEPLHGPQGPEPPQTQPICVGLEGPSPLKAKLSSPINKTFRLDVVKTITTKHMNKQKENTLLNSLG